MNGPILELNTALDELISLITAFDQQQFNQVPFEGSWTGARVGQHLYLAMKGFPKELAKTGTATERDPDEKTAQLKEIFLNMDTKMKSPDFIFPEDKTYDRLTMLADFKALKIATLEAANGLDLSVTTAVAFPGIGSLTKSELLWFAAYHMERHNIQLQDIFEKTTNS